MTKERIPPQTSFLFHGDKELCLTSGGACQASEGIVEKQKLEVRINTTEVLQPRLCLGQAQEGLIFGPTAYSPS